MFYLTTRMSGGHWKTISSIACLIRKFTIKVINTKKKLWRKQAKNLPFPSDNPFCKLGSQFGRSLNTCDFLTNAWWIVSYPLRNTTIWVPAYTVKIFPYFSATSDRKRCRLRLKARKNPTLPNIGKLNGPGGRFRLRIFLKTNRIEHPAANVKYNGQNKLKIYSTIPAIYRNSCVRINLDTIKHNMMNLDVRLYTWTTGRENT